MAWGTVKVDEQRVRFVVSAKRGEKTMSAMCEEFAISRPTGYRGCGAIRRRGCRRGGEEPASAPESNADGQRTGGAGGGVAAAAAGLGRTEVASGAGGRGDSSAGDHGAPDFIAARIGASARPVSRSGKALRARRGESAVADGFQKPAGMGRAGGSAVDSGRSQPLRDRAARNLVDTKQRP